MRFGSAFASAATIGGRSRESAREEGKAAQRYPLLWAIRKEDLAGVRADAAIIRSPSFSRVGESRTMRNSPLAV